MKAIINKTSFYSWAFTDEDISLVTPFVKQLQEAGFKVEKVPYSERLGYLLQIDINTIDDLLKLQKTFKSRLVIEIMSEGLYVEIYDSWRE